MPAQTKLPQAEAAAAEQAAEVSGSLLGQPDVAATLRVLGVADVVPVGPDGASWVYDYGPQTVLKVYAEPDYASLRRYRALAPKLRRADLPFAIPSVIRAGRAAGLGFAIQRRMPGRLFASVLPHLDGEPRARALGNYLLAAERFGTMVFPELPFGHLLSATPIHRPAWPDFLRDWAAAARAEAWADLHEHVPDLGRVVAFYEREAEIVGDVREKRLVHGDYWPANVFVDDQLHVCGVIDFSRLTLVGDPRADVSCAIMYLELVAGHRPDDLRFLTATAVERYGPQMEPILAFYRLHYSFVFAACRRSDPATYRWCVRNLRGWEQHGAR